ncbi:MAG: M14 family metallopeptidase [Akkermansiaceae bacterium]
MLGKLAEIDKELSLLMKFDLTDYTQKVDMILRNAGAVCEVYAEVDGHELRGYDLLRENLPVVYISTGMHGDEPGGPEALLSMLESGLLDRPLSFHVCPMLNPTGFALGTRENARGKDMNRDYHHLRNAEVKGHVKWLEARKPELFISLHEDWESKGFYYYEINTCGDVPERYEYMAERISEVMPLEAEELIDEHAVRCRGWIYHEAEADLMGHWPEAIYMAKRGCVLSFTFESPSALEMRHRVAVQSAAVNSLLDFMYVQK